VGKKLKIDILSDSTSWMVAHLSELKDRFEEDGHEVKLLNKAEQLREGDLAFFLGCFEIVKQEKLALHKNNLVVHASALPNGKGWSPMTWQILEDKNEIPVTLFEAQVGVDSGDIYLQDIVRLSGYELIEEWRDLLGKKIFEMCLNFTKRYPEILTSARKQIGNGSFYERRTPECSRLNLDKTLREQFNLLRVVDNARYPAFFELDGHRYKLKVERYE
jgi:methionyl-tRNA formyltransferase